MAVSNQTNECSICYDKIEPNQPTCFHEINETCSHVFHERCLKEWFDRSKTCPLCRESGNVFVYHNPSEPTKAQKRLVALALCFIVYIGGAAVLKLTDVAMQSLRKQFIS